MKVVVFDIDDILADYTREFLDFVNKRDKSFGKKGKPFESIADVKEKLGRIKYADLKSIYRASGIKRDLKLLDEKAPELIMTLKSKGFQIAMVSSRPVGKHSRIYTDTFIWLLEKGFHFDHLLFSREKHLLIWRTFQDYDKCYVIEDDPFYVEKIASCGFRIFWVVKEKKKLDYIFRNIEKVLSLEEAINKILKEDE